MVDEKNPTSSGISKPDSSKTEKQVNSFVLPSDASKSDISNPYFTHHSDHPGLVLISKPLNGDNYSAWRRAMTLALNAKNKLGFVNGTIKAPSEETHLDDYATWSRCNDMVHSWIVNTLNPEISNSLIYYATLMRFGKIFVSDSLKAMHLTYLRSNEKLPTIDKSNFLSRFTTQNSRACGMNWPRTMMHQAEHSRINKD